MDTLQSVIISLLVVCACITAGYVAYEKGMLDPIIEQVGVMMFKAKANAEREKYQAQGEKAGEDFLDSQLKGNQQAADVISGKGAIGGLKKQL